MSLCRGNPGMPACEQSNRVLHVGSGHQSAILDAWHGEAAPCRQVRQQRVRNIPEKSALFNRNSPAPIPNAAEPTLLSAAATLCTTSFWAIAARGNVDLASQERLKLAHARAHPSVCAQTVLRACLKLKGHGEPDGITHLPQFCLQSIRKWLRLQDRPESFQPRPRPHTNPLSAEDPN